MNKVAIRRLLTASEVMLTLCFNVSIIIINFFPSCESVQGNLSKLQGVESAENPILYLLCGETVLFLLLQCHAVWLPLRYGCRVTGADSGFQKEEGSR